MPDTPEQHEHRVLYKYLSRQVAGLTLSTMTTHWSSPLLYNDPFDTPNNLSFTFPREAVPAIAMGFLDSPEKALAYLGRLSPVGLSVDRLWFPTVRIAGLA